MYARVQRAFTLRMRQLKSYTVLAKVFAIFKVPEQIYMKGLLYMVHNWT